MKSIHLVLFCLLGCCSIGAQSLNTTLRSQVTYTTALNDIWGYVAPDGTEYALVGKRNGVSIVSLLDPDNAVEVANVPGQNSVWRDLKTYGVYAYVVADEGTEGLTIIDLSNLPDSVSFTQTNLSIPGGGNLQRAHNIYVDPAKGWAYISGGNFNSGGNVIYDIATTPGSATYVASGPSVYSHDVYVQDDRMYASEINRGYLAIYDVSNPQNIQLIGQELTPFAFTHNAWTTVDGNYVFTTDERGNAPVAAYDISDPAFPDLLDEFRPQRSLNTNTVPHNVHVIDEYLSISYYTDGLVVADASVPDNIIEVAYYDTWSGPSGGTEGAWGAYPFLPSGLSLITDINNGLFVVDVDYKRAARIKGTIRDADDNSPINDVNVSITSGADVMTNTNAAGKYVSGLANAGDFNITFTKFGYDDLTIPITMENGVELVLDTVMQFNLVTTNLTGNVISSADQSNIANAQVELSNENSSFMEEADENGNVNFTNIPTGTYQLFAAKWGFRNEAIAEFEVEVGSNLTIELDPGYLDGFAVDQGWTATSQGSTTGLWERGEPNGTDLFGQDQANPEVDAAGDRDLGDKAFVTGNADTDNVDADEVNAGRVILTSPVFDATIFENPSLSYQYWYYSETSGQNTGEFYRVDLTNGSETVTLAEYNVNSQNWLAASFEIASLISLSDNMQLSLIAEDLASDVHVLEAGFDDFEVYGDLVSATEEISLPGLQVNVFPNPSTIDFTLSYVLPQQPQREVRLEIIDGLGRLIKQYNLPIQNSGQISLGASWPQGLYFARLLVDGQAAYSTKLQKN